MFHFFVGHLQKHGEKLFLVNDFFWIQVIYHWGKSDWDFFLFPQYDESRKTILYFAFDTFTPKELFEKLLKVNGIGSKTAFLIAQYDQKQLNDAVKNMDTTFFQSIPWIWPKSAKKIILEKKDSIKLEEVPTLKNKKKICKDIIKTLKWLGYESEIVKEKLLWYSDPITKETMPLVIKWIISQM